jgi:3-hydroxyisobutyrate dehydrogenase
MGQDQQPVAGVIGLGRMGTPIAARLRGAGLSVRATDQRPELAATAAHIGVEWADGVAELASGCDVVVSVLPGPAEVREIAETVIAHLRSGAAWIDMTTGVPALSEEIRARAAGRIRVLECPVGGNPASARDGELLGYLGADDEDRLASRWLLDLLCRELVHEGAPGTGYAVKLLANLLWFGQAVAVSEALALAARLGLDPREVRATLARGPAGSRFLEQDAEALLRGDDLTTFALAGCVEELAGLLDLAGSRGLEMPVAEGVTAIYTEALRRYGDVDGELLAARLVAERLGVDFATPAPSGLRASRSGSRPR